MIETKKIQHRGTEINKIHFDEFEYNDLFSLIPSLDASLLFGENDFCYVSNGFVSGLKKALNNEHFEDWEWHHYFVKVDGCFEAEKMQFRNK